MSKSWTQNFEEVLTSSFQPPIFNTQPENSKAYTAIREERALKDFNTDLVFTWVKWVQSYGGCLHPWLGCCAAQDLTCAEVEYHRPWLFQRTWGCCRLTEQFGWWGSGGCFVFLPRAFSQGKDTPSSSQRKDWLCLEQQAQPEHQSFLTQPNISSGRTDKPMLNLLLTCQQWVKNDTNNLSSLCHSQHLSWVAECKWINEWSFPTAEDMCSSTACWDTRVSGAAHSERDPHLEVFVCTHNGLKPKA